MLNFETLKVRAYLQTPVISDKYLPLDSIIFNQFIRNEFGDKVITKPRESEAKIYSGKSLPIQKRNQNEDDWYYACSFAQWSPEMVRDKINYAKRFDTTIAVDYCEFGNKQGKVDTSRGEFKNYFITEYTFNSLWVEWYCRAVKSDIEMLLAFCTHIGKKTSQGFGSVLRWEVENTEKDWYLKNDKGETMRAIPSHKGTAIYGIRPSYWLPKHQTKVILPN